jgi:hypothetical protein
VGEKPIYCHLLCDRCQNRLPQPFEAIYLSFYSWGNSKRKSTLPKVIQPISGEAVSSSVLFDHNLVLVTTPFHFKQKEQREWRSSPGQMWAHQAAWFT